MIGFLFGLILGMAGGGYLAYRYQSTIADIIGDYRDRINDLLGD